MTDRHVPPLAAPRGINPEPSLPQQMAVLCELRETLDTRMCALTDLLEELTGAVRECSGEIRGLRLKLRETDERTESIIERSTANLRVVDQLVTRFSEAVAPLCETIPNKVGGATGKA